MTSPRTAGCWRRAGGWLVLVARHWRVVVRVCVFVLAIMAGATVASLLATAALGFVAFVPFFWLAVLPLQLGAWVLRGAGPAVDLAGRCSGVRVAFTGRDKPRLQFRDGWPRALKPRAEGRSGSAVRQAVLSARSVPAGSERRERQLAKLQRDRA